MKLGLLLAALTSIAPIAGASFQPVLIEPAPSGKVAAGSTESIAWEASDLPPNVEEWEAFLSVDGGRTYPVRLTPHLDASIRRFQWSVPSLPGARLTVMLRFGDERNERRFVFPLDNRITGVALFPQRATTEERGGEAAEEGGEGAVEWVEGARDGSALREVRTRESARLDRLCLESLRSETACATLTRPRARCDSIAVRSVASPGSCPVLARGVPLRRTLDNILLTSTRLNI